ncbi:MAG: hypothetical protein AAF830_10325 [Pseudomonadota bacterium]
MFSGLTLPPALAVALFTIGVVAGYRYRQNWKDEGPGWKSWAYGVTVAICFGSVAFLPVVGR